MTKPQIINRGRGPELAGTRFTVFDVIPFRHKGRNADYIAAVLGLAVEQVEALLQYIDDHEDEVMTQHRVIEARIAQGNAPEVEAKLAASRGLARTLREELLKASREGNGAQGILSDICIEAQVRIIVAILTGRSGRNCGRV